MKLLLSALAFIFSTQAMAGEIVMTFNWDDQAQIADQGEISITGENHNYMLRAYAQEVRIIDGESGYTWMAPIGWHHDGFRIPKGSSHLLVGKWFEDYSKLGSTNCETNHLLTTLTCVTKVRD